MPELHRMGRTLTPGSGGSRPLTPTSLNPTWAEVSGHGDSAAGRTLTAIRQLTALCERDDVSLDSMKPHSAALGVDVAALQAQQATVRQVELLACAGAPGTMQLQACAPVLHEAWANPRLMLVLLCSCACALMTRPRASANSCKCALEQTVLVSRMVSSEGDQGSLLSMGCLCSCWTASTRQTPGP